MRRFLIDTDTASDDAVALLMALRSPDVHVEAITVVAGNVPLEPAVQNALYTVELCEKDTPVHAGLAKPILRPLEDGRHVHGYDGMGDIGLELTGRTPAEGHAVDVIIDTICSSPGEITLVTLGPLSNVAVALLKEPRLAECVKECVVMGGCCVLPGNVTPLAEFNIYVDPEAAKIVFESGMPLVLVGWEESITSGFITMEESAKLEAIGSKYSEFAVGIQSTLIDYLEKNTGMIGYDLPDPLAMAVALDPSITALERKRVDVIAGDGPARGQTVVDVWGVGGQPPNADVAVKVSSEKFQAMLAELFAE